MTTALQSFRNTYQNGLSAPALPSDPLITQSTLTAGLASKAATGANSDITSLLGVSGAGVDIRASETSIASATTTDIGSVGTMRVLIAGVNTITSFGTTPNCVRFIRFNNALTLTYNASKINLPTAANITTAAGDAALAVSDGAGIWTILVYQKASGAALTGSASPGSSSSVQRSIYRYVATSGQNTFGGGDAAANILGYTAGYVDVYYNGRLLSTVDFTASNGTQVSFSNGAAAGDEIVIITYTPVAIQNGVQRNIFRYIATANQTSFSGPDVNSATLGYTPGQADVYWNGRFLSSVDFTATTGTSIVLAAAASQGDEILVISQATITLANAVSTGTQTLNSTQQTQSRTNIAAAAAGINGDISALYGVSGAGVDIRASETTLASAATTDLGTVMTLRALITGSATITSFGSLANGLRFLRFSGAVTLSYNATSLILPGAANITTTAGDTAIAVSDGSGNWTIIAHQRATALGNGTIGQCRLVYSASTQITLIPWDGNQLFINGALRTIPSAGVNLANTGLTAATLYYVYASYSGSTMSLNASTTAYVVSSTYGHKTMSGDTTQTLVGMIYADAGTPGTFADASAKRYVASYFNRRRRVSSSGYTNASTAATSGFVELAAFKAAGLTWGDNTQRVSFLGYANDGYAGGHSNYTQIWVDGSAVSSSYITASVPNAYAANHSCELATTLAEGFHYIDIAGYGNSGNTVTWYGQVDYEVMI